MPDPNPDPHAEGSSRKQNRSDDDLLQKYFTLLLGQYKTMGEKVDDKAVLEEAERVAKIPVEKISWEDIYNFELAILKLEPAETLRRKAWTLREEFEEIANETEKQHYKASNPPDPATSQEAQLRADLVRLQVELNWAYTMLWVQEGYRGKLTREVVLLTLIVVVFFGLVLVVMGGFSTQLTLLAVAFAGMLGGCINTVRRIQKSNLDGNSDLNMIQLERGKLSIYLSPFLGSVFAVVLYAIFASGSIKSGVFPDYTSNNEMLFGLFPVLKGTELAKLLVWSFIAGFAEQFVPDRLAQLTKRADEEEANKKRNSKDDLAPARPSPEELRKIIQEVKASS